MVKVELDGETGTLVFSTRIRRPRLAGYPRLARVEVNSCDTFLKVNSIVAPKTDCRKFNILPVC